MEKEASPFSTTASWDVTLAADGMEQKVDENTLFCTPDPMAASTVSREAARTQPPTTADSKGSFLDDLSRLSMQSVSALDLTNQLRQLNFTTASDCSPQENAPCRDVGPDLIQFSGATDAGNADQDTSKSDSLTDVSSRSSMGLIPSDMLNELSASVLPMATPKVGAVQGVHPKEVDTMHSALKERTGDSTDWSDNSKQDSKQDSKDLPWSRSHLETVKKRPQSVEESDEGPTKRVAARGAIALFGGHLLDDVEESEENDHSVYNVELGDEDLKQLDADVDFSDLEDNLSVEEGRESGDEDFDFDEPMLSLPTRGRVERGTEDPEDGREEQTVRTLQAELAEAENRLGEGQESEEEDVQARRAVRSSTDSGLDSRYFRKTPMVFAGDGEDTEIASNRGSLTANSQQRGAAEGEHLLTKLRRQFMSGDGSENEIDTDDELEAARKTLAMAARERGQGADEEDRDRSNLPLPVGLEDDKTSNSGSYNSSSSRGAQQQTQFFTTRLSAEGDTACSPVPWDGGGGGDGSSGGDSDGGDRKSDTRPPYRFVSGAAKNPDTSGTDHLMISSGETAKDESGLPSMFFLPSSHSMLQDSEAAFPTTHEGSTFTVEDVLKFKAETPSAATRNQQDAYHQFEASGFNAADVPENPFEDQFVGSFGSFELGQDGDEKEDKKNERSPDRGIGNLSALSNKTDCDKQRPTNTSASFNAPPSKGSGSFDGPFRKPRAPPPPKKKAEKKDVFTAVSGSSESWKNITLPGINAKGESNLEKELRELGIHVGDDDFQTADSAMAMLDADEKQFEAENKFSEHHQLALAAEGLAWEDGNNSLSGYLGGEENPEHLETSIGTYMAARTETLGTLGGDPNTPRPEFGKPVQSPPHRPYPIKLMSPPSTASSVLLNSRTEGEGDEDGDKTMVSGDSTLHASSLASPDKLSSPQPAAEGRKKNVSVADDVAAKAAAEGRAAAETTLREELSSLLLDLTNGGGDMSMEDALSMSSVFDFIKNHSYTNSSEFATAILKISQGKKQQQRDKKAAESGLSTLTEKTGRQERRGERSNTDSTVSGHGNRGKSGDTSPLHSSALFSDCQSKTDSSSSSSPSSGTPRLRGSKLPVRVKEGSSPKERLSGKTNISAISVTQRVSASEQQPEGHIRSENPPHAVPKYNATRVSDVCFTENQPDVNRQSSDQLKNEVSKRVIDQRQDRATSSSSKVSSSKTEASRTNFQTFSEDQTKDQRQRSSKTDFSDKKGSSPVHVKKDQVLDTPNVAKASGEHSQSGLYQSSEKLARQEQSKQKHHHDIYKEYSEKIGQSSSSLSSTIHPENIPLNIPIRSETDISQGLVNKEKGLLQENKNYSRSDAKGPFQEETSPQQHMLQTPPQRLPATDQHCTDLATATKEFDCQEFPDNIPPGLSSPRSSNLSHHVPDGMENAIPGLNYNKSSHEVSRQQAVGMDNGDLMESRPFDLVTRQQGIFHPLNNAQKQRQDAPQEMLSEGQRQQSTRPTLLTDGSLLKTEFAQKFLNSGGNSNSSSSEMPMQTAGQYVSSQSATRVPPDHLHSSKKRDVALKVHPSVRAQSVASRPNSHLVEPAQGETSMVSQRFHLPNTTVQAMDESTASVYYELNEDLQQSTMLGGESSALGSFWGKSPLYQSTPAFEVGKVAAVSMMGSRLDERELTTPNTNMVTPRVQRQLIDIQRNVDFPEFCCLGVSQKTSIPVTNRTAFGVVCRFRLVQLLHNGTAVKVDQQSPFELKPKLSISAGACENLPVLFVPRRPGEQVCQVEVVAQSLNPSLEHTSTVIQLRAVAEVPHIQISPSVEVLHVGEVMWGACVSKIIKLRNIKRASLPVRLSIWSGSSVWHCFTFESSENSSDMSLISMSSRPESLGRNVTTVILPGCESPEIAKTVEITVYCRPPKKDLNRTLAERPADKIEAKIDIEVDTPVQYLPPLASVLLQATVGMPRLLIPPTHMSLTFKTEPNKNIQESILVTNAGNICLDLALSVTTFPECFKISPPNLSIKPGGRDEVAVIFSPLESDVYRYQSLLLMDIEPEGPSYEIPMEARVNQPSVQPAALSILTSKSYLSFNGVPLNQTKSLTVRLYNKESHKAEHACVEIRQSSDCFKLVSASGEWQQKCDVVIEPKEKVSLTVIFCPTAVRGYSAKLVIKKRDTYSSKYSIPLSGYGGRSVLALSGACQTNSGQRWLELGAVSVGHNIMRDVVLTNSGVRAAFVRATAFFDMPCRQPVPPGRVAVEPNNFVLASGCSMKVMVAISPSQREIDLVKDRKEVVAVVRFQHGDEVMRQKYQRACAREGNHDPHSWQAAFRQQFINEVQDSITLEGRTIPDSPNDTSAFFHHLSSQCVALLAEPHPGRETSSLSVSTVLQTAAAAPTQAETAAVPTHDTSSLRHREVSRRPDSSIQVPNRPESDDGDWTVKPDFLSLTVGENNQKILQLINFSRQPLRFELSWPPSSVVPEPQKGELKPRSSTSVEVWLHMAWQKRLMELPWRGAITISCNGREKKVRVTVQKPTQPPMLPLSSNSSPVSVSNVSVRSPRDTASASTTHSIQLASSNIHFPKAKVNGVHENVIELTNTSMDPLHWKMSAFAPPYVKGADDTNTIQRVGYSVFTISPTSADLLPQETMKVPVKFCPQTKGTYNQHWEIEYQPLMSGRVATQTKMATRISLTAEVRDTETVPSKKLTWEPVERDKTGVVSTRTPLQEKHPNTVDKGGEQAPVPAPELQLIHPDVTFSNTKVGHVTQVKIEFKNSLDHNVDLEVVPPKAPFRIKHKNFKITKKRFLKYPIEFGPSAAGSFADTVVFRAHELGKTFTVFLKGTAL